MSVSHKQSGPNPGTVDAPVAYSLAGGVGGGSIQHNTSMGWRWAMYITAITYALEFLLQLFFGKQNQHPI
jgi:hypothetical protein